MVRRVCLAMCAALVLASAAAAQSGAWLFRWQPGQVLNYRVQEDMSEVQVVNGSRIETSNKLTVGKRWQVLAVDAAGVATLQLSVTALRQEQVRPNGEVMFFDSADLDKSDVQLRQQMMAYIGKPIAVLRVDGKGRVVEVKECQFGSAAKFQNELPFTIALPDTDPQAGQVWERVYQVVLDPPLGTGEKYDVVQKCTFKAATAATATIGVAATFKTLPQALGDQAPLLRNQPEGEVVFDLQAGRLQSVTLHVDKELKGVQGEGSTYRFQRSLVEQYTGGN